MGALYSSRIFSFTVRMLYCHTTALRCICRSELKFSMSSYSILSFMKFAISLWLSFFTSTVCSPLSFNHPVQKTEAKKRKEEGREQQSQQCPLIKWIIFLAIKSSFKPKSLTWFLEKVPSTGGPIETINLMENCSRLNWKWEFLFAFHNLIKRSGYE